MKDGRRREKELQRQCRAVLRDLDIQPPLDVRQLCERIGEQRRKPIKLLPHPIPVPGPFGVWITTKDADYILFQEKTTPAHQDHIILHELGHMLAGHQGDGQDDELLSGIYPELEPDAVRTALRRTAYGTEGRTAYDDTREREAELMATMILEWASVVNRVPRRMGDTTPVGRYDNALADRVGWL
jgi:hypothetical protein